MPMISGAPGMEARTAVPRFVNNNPVLFLQNIAPGSFVTATKIASIKDFSDMLAAPTLLHYKIWPLRFISSGLCDIAQLLKRIRPRHHGFPFLALCEHHVDAAGPFGGFC